VTDKKQSTDRAGSVASGGAAALAGSEDPSPGPATEPAAVPSDLPKALSQYARNYLSCSNEGNEALTLLDAITELLAEQAAQIVLDGQTLSEAREIATRNANDCQHLRQSAIELARERDDWKRTAESGCARCEEREPALDQFRTTVVSLTQDLERERARVADGLTQAHAEAQRWHERANCAEQKLTTADALLADFNFSSAESMCDWLRRRDAHLSGQPAAPAPTDFVSDAIRSACTKLGMAPEAAERLAEKPAAPTSTEAEIAAVEAASGDDLAGALACCRAWDPCARLVGNVRAGTLLNLLERTEAEQAVLDAMGGLNLYKVHATDEVRIGADGRATLVQALAAELTRRGLK
jgi:hypothetical protein